MSRVARLIIYEGTNNWLQEQLSRSLPDGTKDCKDGEITLITIGSSDVLESYIGTKFYKAARERDYKVRS